MPGIFQLDFMVRAFIAGGIVGVAGPLLGTFLVLRRLSLIADTLAHVAITGAAIGLLLQHFPVAVAVITSAAAAVLLEELRSARWLAGDSALALILYTALALALLFVSLGKGLSINLFGYLFGSIVTVGVGDVWATAALGIAVFLTVWLLYAELVQTTFDPDLAKVSGVPIRRVNVLLAVLTGITVTLSMRVVGGLLVGALIVFPVLASLQLRRGFRTTLLVAASIGAASVWAGLVISYYWNVASSAAIVLVALAALATVSGLRIVGNRAGTAR